jgi:probable HAF family extracellular repeat protein
MACGVNEGSNPVGSEESGPPIRLLQTAGISVIDLGSLGGNSWANAINEFGQVVGVSSTMSAPPFPGGRYTYGSSCCPFDIDGPTGRAVLWQDGDITDLGTLGGLQNAAVGINDLGQVVGFSGPDAFLWQAGVLTDLNALLNENEADDCPFTYFCVLSSRGLDINNAGSIVGAYENPFELFGFHYGHPAEGYAWHFISLGSDGDAQAINESGQVVGGVLICDGGGSECPHHAYREDGFFLTDLPPVNDFVFSTATDINDLGQVVGGSSSGGSVSHATLWDNGSVIDLGTLGGDKSHATGINNKGQIVGWSTTADNTGPHAFLWEDGVMVELGSLGGGLSGALDINEQGRSWGGAI